MADSKQQKKTEKFISKLKLTSKFGEKLMELISVSSKGQIVIPEKVRKHLEIKTGSKLILLEKDGGLVLKKEEEIIKHFEHSDKKEELAWMILAEKSLRDVWDNPKDEKVWKKYLRA